MKTRGNYWLKFIMTGFFLLVAAISQAQSLVDQDGQRINFDKPFTRIISLYPAHTENLFSLGLDSQIVGVSMDDDFPAAVQSKPRFDFRADPERIIAARPDLVLVRPMISRSQPDLLAKLRLAGITVVSLQPNDLKETFAYWRDLGRLTGRDREAEQMVDGFNARLAAIGKAVATIPAKERQRVYFEAIHRKMKTFAPDSMAIFALTAAGGINAAPDAAQVRKTNIADYGLERLLAKADEIDVFLAQRGRMNRITAQGIYDEPGLAALKAVKNRQVFLIDEALVSRPTPRLIEGIIDIGRLLYPQVFKAFPQ